MEIDHEEEGGVLQGEGLPTSTGRLGLRVVEHEASLEVIFHVVHLGSNDVQEGFGSHKNFHACFRSNHRAISPINDEKSAGGGQYHPLQQLRLSSPFSRRSRG